MATVSYRASAGIQINKTCIKAEAKHVSSNPSIRWVSLLAIAIGGDPSYVRTQRVPQRGRRVTRVGSPLRDDICPALRPHAELSSYEQHAFERLQNRKVGPKTASGKDTSEHRVPGWGKSRVFKQHLKLRVFFW